VYLGWLKLERPLSLIGSLPAVANFTLLAVVELVADKLPADTEPHSAAGPHSHGIVMGVWRVHAVAAGGARRNFYRRSPWRRRQRMHPPTHPSRLRAMRPGGAVRLGVCGSFYQPPVRTNREQRKNSDGGQ